MIRAGIISDTHGYLDERILKHLSDCDEIWHAGDFGNAEVARQLQQLAPLRGVYGNIDGRDIRSLFTEDLWFGTEGLRVFMTHIGGYPGRYVPRVRKLLDEKRPGLFVCGHSHILKVMPDSKRSLLHINPGAAGRNGFHKVRTLVKIEIADGRVADLKVIELGNRSVLS